MKPALCLVLFFCGFAAVFCDDHGTAPLYTKANFKEKTKDHPHFVMFFAPWCGHCKRLAPTWDKLAEKYNADPEKHGSKIARVDCTLETALCKDNEVSGYPTLKFFKKGAEPVRHKGGRDQDALEKFIKEQLGVKVEEEKKEEEKKPEGVKLENIIDLTSDSFPEHIKTGFRFIKFYAPWCPHCQNLERTWDTLAFDFKDNKDVAISRLDCTEHKQICMDNKVTGYPTLLWFSDGQKIEKYAGGRNIVELKAYVTKMMNMKTPGKDATEEKIPDDREALKEEVPSLTKENFAESIKTGTAFVKFYAPWCGHCKRLAPTWEDLGKKFASNENVKIAKVDCTQHREVCSENGVRGFPTLILFRNGKKEIEHNGPRDLDTLYSFVRDKMPRDEL